MGRFEIAGRDEQMPAPCWRNAYCWVALMAVVTVAVLTAAAVHGEGSTVVLRLGNHALSVSLTHDDAGSSSSSAEPVTDNAADPGDGLDEAGAQAEEKQPAEAEVPADEQQQPAEEAPADEQQQPAEEAPADEQAAEEAAPADEQVVDPSTLPCQASGYCSLGKSKVWTGDVATNEALREMLEAVSFKKEIIFACSDMNGYQVEVNLNVVRSAQVLGYGHALILAMDSEGCGRIPAPFNETVSCVWDSRPMLDAGAVFNVYQRRWEFFARAARMGFNVLGLDADTMLVADFYSFVKSPPFAQVNLLTQDDGGGVNCGVVYIQNSHPSGPAVWAAVDHAYRTNRQRENVSHMQAVFNGWELGSDTWEQPMWNQVVGSVTAGLPVHFVSGGNFNEKNPQEWRAAAEGSGMHSRLTVEQRVWPTEWRERTGLLNNETNRWQVIENLTLPLVGHPDGAAWWAQYSKYIYPPTAGNWSTSFLELIKSSSDQPFYELGQPWDPAAVDVPPESFGFFPCWFTCGYAFRGWYGHWNTEPPAAVVLHNVWLPAITGDWKMFTFRTARLWNWDVTEAVHGHNVLGMPDPKLLMLSPGVELFTETEDGFLAAVTQLARVASALGRQLVVPNPPCDSMWLGIVLNPSYPHQFLQLWEGMYDGWQVLQGFDTMRPPGKTYCLWMRTLAKQCLPVVSAHTDAVAFIERYRDQAKVTPGKHNTLWHAQWLAAGGAEGRPAEPRQAITSPRPSVDVADVGEVAAEAQAFADVPVLFLGAVPQLGSNETLPPLEERFKECYLFADAPPHWGPSGTAGDVRLAWLNGTLQMPDWQLP